jgi:hypothetical protein
MRKSIITILVALALVGSAFAIPLVGRAQEATPTADQFPFVPDPAECTGEQADVNALLDLWYGPDGSPIAADTSAAVTATEVTIPIGTPADEQVKAEVITVVRGVFSCFAAGDASRAFAFFTDQLASEFGPEPGTPREDAVAYMTGTPQPESEEERSTLVAVTDVMLLSDGRVGAFVIEEFGGETLTSYAIFVQQDGHWLLDDVIEFTQFADEDEQGTPVA